MCFMKHLWHEKALPFTGHVTIKYKSALLFTSLNTGFKRASRLLGMCWSIHTGRWQQQPRDWRLYFERRTGTGTRDGERERKVGRCLKWWWRQVRGSLISVHHHLWLQPAPLPPTLSQRSTWHVSPGQRDANTVMRHSSKQTNKQASVARVIAVIRR